MKLLSLVVFLVLGLTCSKTGTENDKWDSIAYMFESGPVSPVYQFNYIININADGNSVLTYTFDMRRENNLVYKFQLTKEQIETLDSKVNNSKVMTEKIPAIPDNQVPIGGSLQKVRVVFVNLDPYGDKPPKMKESPYFPEAKYQPALTELYDYMKTLVPAENWKDAENKRNDFINKNNN